MDDSKANLDIYARLAERRRLPALGLYVAFAAYGGLVAYGPDMLDILAILRARPRRRRRSLGCFLRGRDLRRS